jgi:uncharacterized membrane protein
VPGSPEPPAAAARRFPRGESEFDRAVAFFDATYAFALTLLVTTLDVVGEPSAWSSFSALDDAVGSQFIGFLISFVVISGFWLRNHRLLSSFAAIDTPMIILNLALLAAIVLLPFTTEAMGDERVNDLPVPLTVYAINIAVASGLSVAVYLAAAQRGLLAEADDRATVRLNVLSGLVPAAIFLLSIPVAYLASPGIARWCWFALVAYGIAIHRLGSARA